MGQVLINPGCPIPGRRAQKRITQDTTSRAGFSIICWKTVPTRDWYEFKQGGQRGGGGYRRRDLTGEN